MRLTVNSLIKAPGAIQAIRGCFQAVEDISTFQRFYRKKIGLLLAEILSETWKITRRESGSSGCLIGVGAFIEELILYCEYFAKIETAQYW